MTTLLHGTYHHGRVDLLEQPVGLREGRVRVLLIEELEPKTKSQFLQPGKYGQDNSTLDDFKEAEWHGELCNLRTRLTQC